MPFVVVSPMKEVSGEIGILREQSLSSVDSKMESITSNDSDEKAPDKKDKVKVMLNSVKGTAALDTPVVKSDGCSESKDQGNFNFVSKSRLQPSFIR